MNNSAFPDELDLDAMSGIDFAPLKELPSSWAPPTNVEWANLANPHLISVRLAWLTLHKTKDELVEMAAGLGDDVLTELVAQIGQSADWFEGLHKVLTSAECRIMCAYAALAATDQEGG